MENNKFLRRVSYILNPTCVLWFSEGGILTTLLQANEIEWNLYSKHDDFIRLYRLSENLVNELEKEVTPFMPVNVRASGLSIKSKILCTLSFLANGNYQKKVGENNELFLSQPSACRSIRQVVDALNNPQIVKKYISLPDNSDERRAHKQRFYEDFKMPEAVGCVGNTHVSIIKPREQEQLYYNRHAYHSKNVLIINDADLNILHVNATHGGAIRDKDVFESTNVKEYLEEIHNTGEVLYLLGDSRYPLLPYLMTPINNPEPGSPEEYYNFIHSNACNSVQRTLDILKGRFRCLLVHKTLYYAPHTVTKIVTACCVLHNMCNRAGLPAPSLSNLELKEEHRMLTKAEPSLVEDIGNSQARACREELMNELWQARD